MASGLVAGQISGGHSECVELLRMASLRSLDRQRPNNMPHMVYHQARLRAQCNKKSESNLPTETLEVGQVSAGKSSDNIINVFGPNTSQIAEEINSGCRNSKNSACRQGAGGGQSSPMRSRQPGFTALQSHCTQAARPSCSPMVCVRAQHLKVNCISISLPEQNPAGNA